MIWVSEHLSIPQKILVWLSWGVDSAVSAWLLKAEGHDVACGFMINYLDEEHSWICPTRADLEAAQKVAAFLELPFYTFDYREEYEKRIVDYIYREYAAGRTPNPDVFCNNLVKFDLFLEEALTLGYDSIATGHYARIEGWNVWRFENWWLGNESTQDSNIPRFQHSISSNESIHQKINPTSSHDYQNLNSQKHYFL